MPRRLALTLLLALPALAAAVPPAHAGWYGAEAIDGPADIEQLGGVDLARDGTGGLVYIKRDGGVPHVFASRFIGGSWRPPERVDAGIDTPASDAAIAVADAYRLAVVWTTGNKVYASVVQGNDEQPGPLQGPMEVYANPGGEVSDVTLDMGINGTAYAAFAVRSGATGSDIVVARLQRLAWQVVPSALDIDPSQPAGRGTQRARVAVSAEGNGLVVWGENHPDGRPRVYARRVTGITPSLAPQELSLPAFENQPGGRADLPDVDIEDDGSFAWAVFRQDFGGTSRAVARRLLGSQFEAPVAIDGGQYAGAPRISINGRGQGLSVTGISGGGVLGDYLFNDVFEGAQGLHAQTSAQDAEPVAAASEHRDVALAWRHTDPSGVASLRGRLKPDEARFEGEVQLSGGLGTIEPGQFAIASDRLAGFAVAMIQGATLAGRYVTVAVPDRPPGRPGGQTTGTWQRRARPRFKWAPGIDLWGQQRFRVIVGGQVVGETTATSLTPNVTLTTGRPLPWRVIAIDRRGQQVASKERFVRLDKVAPRVVARVRGRRKARQPLKVTVTGLDGRGSGVSYVEVQYGDRTGTVKQPKRFSGTHRYRRRGTFRLRVRVVDNAGNVARKAVRLRIAR